MGRGIVTATAATAATAAVLLLAGACDGDGGDGGDDSVATTTAPAESPADGPAGEITVASTAFESEGEIPARYGLAGDNVSPALTWSVTVDGAAELILVVEDPDAPGDDPFVHWLVAGIDPSTGGIQEGSVPAGAVEGTTDFGEAGYGGPAPPGGERHRYVFRLIALDAPSGLEAGFTWDDLDAVLDEHFLLSGEFAGFFQG